MKLERRRVGAFATALTLVLLASACGEGELADATGRGVGDLSTTAPPTETTATVPPVGSSTQAPGTSASSTTLGTVSSTTVAGELVRPEPVIIPVRFGDEVLTEVRPDPSGGAGRLGAFGEEDVYSFDVVDDQSFLVEQLGDCDFDGDDNLSMDIDGPGINSGDSFFEDKCRSASRFTSDATGTVEIVVADRRGEVTGNYSFRVIDVTDPDPITLVNGDEVSPNFPTRGAGWIENRGHRDIYHYEIADDGAVLLEQLGGCDFDGDDAIVADVDGPGINSTAVFLEDGCTSASRYESDGTGRVTIIVSDVGNDVFGTYAFRITDVTDPDPIELVDGMEIRPDAPAGAGRLEDRGMRDIFFYQATEGQAFVIEQLGVCDLVGNDNILIDLDGAGINRGVIVSDGDCTSSVRFEPDESEVVRIVVMSVGNDAWGTYSFVLKEVS